MNNPSAARPGKRFRAFVQWFDTLFIMALCFVTLLVTMLLRGKVLVGNGAASVLDYSVGIGSCMLVLVTFAVYVCYMLRHSERELRDMVNHVYGPNESAGPQSKSDPKAESVQTGETKT